MNKKKYGGYVKIDDAMYKQLGLGDWLGDNASSLVKTALGGAAMFVPGLQTVGAGMIADGVGGIVQTGQENKITDANNKLAIKNNNIKGLQNQLETEYIQPGLMKAEKGGYIPYNKGSKHSDPLGGIPVDQMGNPVVSSKQAPSAVVEKGEVSYIFPDGRALVLSESEGDVKEFNKIKSKYKLRLGNDLKGHDTIAQGGLLKDMNNLSEKVTARNASKKTEGGLPIAAIGGEIPPWKDQYNQMSYELNGYPVNSNQVNPTIPPATNTNSVVTKIPGTDYTINNDPTANYNNPNNTKYAKQSVLNNQPSEFTGKGYDNWKNIINGFDDKTLLDIVTGNQGKYKLDPTIGGGTSEQQMQFIRDNMTDGDWGNYHQAAYEYYNKNKPVDFKGGIQPTGAIPGTIPGPGNGVMNKLIQPETTPSVEGKLYDPVKSSALTAGIGGAATILGNLAMSKLYKEPKPIAPDLIQAPTISLESARQSTRDQGTIARNAGTSALRNTGITKGALAANTSGLTTGVQKNINDNVSNSYMTEENTNKQLQYSADQFNAQAKNQMAGFNAQRKDQYDYSKLPFYQGALGAVQGVTNDISQARNSRDYLNINASRTGYEVRRNPVTKKLEMVPVKGFFERMNKVQ